jgi:hypothetical protein
MDLTRNRKIRGFFYGRVFIDPFLSMRLFQCACINAYRDCRTRLRQFRKRSWNVSNPRRDVSRGKSAEREQYVAHCLEGFLGVGRGIVLHRWLRNI